MRQILRKLRRAGNKGEVSTAAGATDLDSGREEPSPVGDAVDEPANDSPGLKRIRRMADAAWANRPCASPRYAAQPVSVHDSEYHALKRANPYFGFVSVTVEGAPEFVMFTANHDDNVASLYFFYGADAYEPMSLKIWTALAKRSGTIYDVGAFSGVYTLAAKRANPKAGCHAFEPLGVTRGRLVVNLMANSIARGVEVEPLGISDAREVVPLHIKRGKTILDTGASIERNPEKTVISVEYIQTTKLDDFTAEHSPPDLIKIDVEMHEAAALRGARQTLENHHPALIIEVLSLPVLVEVQEFLSSYGYNLFVIDDKNMAVRPVNDKMLSGNEGWTNANVLALFRGQGAEEPESILAQLNIRMA